MTSFLIVLALIAKLQIAPRLFFKNLNTLRYHYIINKYKKALAASTVKKAAVHIQQKKHIHIVTPLGNYNRTKSLQLT